MCDIVICARALRFGGADYKPWDPMAVAIDGHEWGADEGLPNFWLLQILGVSTEKAVAYLAQSNFGGTEDGELLRKRVWCFNEANVPQMVKDAFDSTGVFKATGAAVKSQIAKALTHKDTGEEADLNG